MAVARPLHLRLFLEGIEVPVIGASVSINENAPAAAAIQVIPLDEASLLKPRTMVHLFYLESRAVIEKTPLGTQQTSTLGDYRLLFSGEVLGFNVVLRPDGRELVLQCLDFSTYWDSAHVTAIEYGPNGNAFYPNVGTLEAGNNALIDNIINTHLNRILLWSSSTPETEGLRGVTGLAGGVIRLMEAVGGITDRVKGMNDFFTTAELRCRLLAQISAEEKDNTAYDLFDKQAFEAWIRNGLQNEGQQATMRDLMKMLFRLCYYDVVPNPAAKYDPPTTGSGAGPETGISGVGVKPGVVVDGQLVPEMVLAVNKIKSITTGTKFADPDAEGGLTITSVREGDHVTNSRHYVGRAVDLRTRHLKAPGLAAEWAGAIRKTLGPNFRTIFGDKDHLDHIHVQFSPRDEKGRSILESESTSTTARLRTQIIRPDCWFVAPPRCNVVFPEQYSSFSFDRNFMSESTRHELLLFEQLVGMDQLFAERILEPHASLQELLVRGAGEEGYRVLMDHELHTGIIPRYEWMSNVNVFKEEATPSKTKKDKEDKRRRYGRNVALFHFFKNRFSPRSASVAGHFNPYLVCGFPAMVITRPYILPSGAISGSSDAEILDTIDSKAQEYRAPSHYLGMVHGLQHSVNQNGGTTTFSLHHARQHLGVDDEYLKVLSTAKQSSKRRVKVPLTFQSASKSKDSKLLKKLVDLTPQVEGPESVATTNVTEVTTTVVTSPRVDVVSGQVVSTSVDSTVSRGSEESVTSTPPQLVALGKIDGVSRSVWVPSPPGKLSEGGDGIFGKIIGVEVLAPVGSDPQTVVIEGKKAYSAVVLYEEVESSGEDPVSIEDILHPDWLSPLYRNENIGPNIYQPFFGVSSIVDELMFLGINTDYASSREGLQVDATSSKEAVQVTVDAISSARRQMSIQRAGNLIGFLYGNVVANGLDVHEFVRSFTYRPIATLEDIFGRDVELSIKGTDVELVSGTLGFHTLAVHEAVVKARNLTGLLVEPDTHMSRIDSNGAETPVSPRFDVRLEKRERVAAYSEALMKNSAFRG